MSDLHAKVYEAIAKTMIGTTVGDAAMRTAIEEVKGSVKIAEEKKDYLKLVVPKGWANTTKRRIEKVVGRTVAYGTRVVVE